jgi:hypothetical protein
VLIADTAAGLFDPAQRRTFLTRTATGVPRGFVNVWRGSATDHCTRWTSTTMTGRVAIPSTIGSAFDDLGSNPSCISSYPLVCLQE